MSAATVLVIDNYDSFTYNLVQALGSMGLEPAVFRNDAIDVDGVRAREPSCIVISPGPGRPPDAGVSMDVIRAMGPSTPILGVCLGQQCVAEAFGARITFARTLMHGKTAPVRHDGLGVYRGLPDPFEAMRYHSLAVDPDSLSEDLVATAWAPDGELMGLRHRTLPIEGVQFHPESFMTPDGRRLLANFVKDATQ